MIFTVKKSAVIRVNVLLCALDKGIGQYVFMNQRELILLRCRKEPFLRLDVVKLACGIDRPKTCTVSSDVEGSLPCR